MASKRELMMRMNQEAIQETRERRAANVLEDEVKDEPVVSTSSNNLVDDIIKDLDEANAKESEKANGLKYAMADDFMPYEDAKLRLDIHAGEELDRLRESIEKNGIMEPVIATPINGKLMLISGHNRVHIAKELGIEVPYILKENLTKEEMDLICIDTNLLNRQIVDYKVSQLAYILKVKMDAEKHQGAAFSNDSKHTGTKIGEEYGLSRTQIFRYIKMNELIPEALKLVDNKDLTMKTAYELAFFESNIQEVILDCRSQFTVNEKNLKIIRDNLMIKSFDSDDEKVTFVKSQLLDLCFTGKQTHKLDYRNIKKYLPSDLKEAEVESYVIQCIKKYRGID